MRTVTILASMALLTAATSVQARDNDDLSQWSLENLCEKKDKPRHAEAIFAEIEGRGIFTSVDLALVRSGKIEVGMSEAALRCSWGKPDSVSQLDAAALHTYRNRVDGLKRTFEVRLVAERVTAVHVRRGSGPYVFGTGPTSDSHNWNTFSGRFIEGSGVSDIITCPSCSIFSRP